MEEKNIFADVNAEKNRITNSIKRTAKNYLPYILLIVNIVFRILLQLYTTEYENPLTLKFFLDTSTSLVSTMFCYIVFIPLGEANEKNNSLSYRTNCTRWGELSTRIRKNGMLEAFRTYCQEQLEIERKATKEAIIGNNTTFSFEEYIERFSHRSDEELKELYENGELTKEEYKAIKKCNGKIKVKPISSVLILTGVAKANYNDAGRDESNYIFRWLAQRPMLIVAVSIILNALSPKYVGFRDLAVIYAMVIDILFIILASFVGYGAGEESVRNKDDKVKSRILFLEGFLEKNQ